MPVSADIRPTNWEQFGTEHDDAWMPALSPEELELVSQSTSGSYTTLTPQETEAVLTISAKRISPVKQFSNGKYREENRLKLAFAGNLPIVEACRNTVLIGILVAPIAFYMSGISNSQANSDNASHVKSTTTVKVARQKAPTQRHIKAGSSKTSAGIATAESVDPEAALVGVPEYKGPSSVTGISLPHRHAYQTASIGTQAAE